MGRFAEVAVDVPVGSDHTFSYSVPDSLSILPGHLVRVPFGSRTLQGIVFSVGEEPQVSDTRDIIDVRGPAPHLDEIRLSLARWLSRYYRCSLFEAAALMLPPGGRIRARTFLSVADNTPGDCEVALTPFQSGILDHIRSRGTVEQQRLIRRFGDRANGAIASLVRRGIVSQTVARRRPVAGPKRVQTGVLTDLGRSEGSAWLAGNGRRAPRQAALLQALIDDGRAAPLSELRREHGASAVKGLIDRGYVETRWETVLRDPLRGRDFARSAPVRLTSSQKDAVYTVCAALDDDSASPRAFVVQGVTGSGKTEVYLAAAERCLSLRKKIIVLVPEIALTHQTVERFASRFPGRIAVLHSGISDGERFDQWWQTRRGAYDVVIGSRSAIFAPLPDVGLIVIDEEHEWTYKQVDAGPRYHARDAAMKLAELTGAVVVMGSASPDLVSYHAALRGRVGLLVLPNRVRTDSTGASLPGRMPGVEIVDMRRELREGNRGVFSRRLDDAMRECLSAGRQMVLFVNRRGSASHVQCRGCGYSLRCRRCEIALTYHRSAARLICHYCGERRKPTDRCPRCLAQRIGYSGTGTESVERDINDRFPAVEVLRLDSDTARGAGSHERLLSRFGSGQARVLIGTQMVTKGLHFPDVTLVGVVSADVGLNIPDYRSGERVFQLLCQVAGRAGRGAYDGTVIVQTYQPDNYAIRAAAAQDYAAFYSRELSYRRQQGNPPFGRMVRLRRPRSHDVECRSTPTGPDARPRLAVSHRSWSVRSVRQVSARLVRYRHPGTPRPHTVSHGAVSPVKTTLPLRPVEPVRQRVQPRLYVLCRRGHHLPVLSFAHLARTDVQCLDRRASRGASPRRLLTLRRSSRSPTGRLRPEHLDGRYRPRGHDR